MLIKKGRLNIPESSRFKDGNIPANRVIDVDLICSIKKRIINGDFTTLKALSLEFNVGYQFIRDLKSGRTFKNIGGDRHLTGSGLDEESTLKNNWHPNDDR